jgi:hypothetical protein
MNPLLCCPSVLCPVQGLVLAEAQSLALLLELLQARAWACWDERKDLVLSRGCLDRRRNDGYASRVDRR